jgi:hypothetical protein
MGNYIGSIYWPKTNDVEEFLYREKLDMIRKKYDLDLTNVNCVNHKDNMNQYSVDITGVWLGIYGHNFTNYLVKSFLDEASLIFKNDNIEYETDIYHLPL